MYLPYENVLVKLKGAREPMIFKAYEDGILWLESPKHRLFTYSYDSGLLSDQTKRKEAGWSSAYESSIRDDGKVSLTSFLAKTNDTKMQFAGPKLTLDQTQLLTALASSQVRGDEVLKGLRARGYRIQAKFTENFLGGWIIEIKNQDEWFPAQIDDVLDMM